MDRHIEVARKQVLRAGWVGAALALSGAAADAQSASSVQRYDIPAGPLQAALERFSAASGMHVQAGPGLLQGRQSPGAAGSFSADEALRRLLEGSGVVAGPAAAGSYALSAAPDGAGQSVVIEGQRARLFDQPRESPGLKADAQDSATKMSMPIRETPQSISVVTRDSMDLRQVRDVNSALELVAGASVSGSAFAGHNPRTGEEFILRGQTLDPSRDVRIDGFSAMADRNNLDLAPFERVEAVKGPSSMLYGQGSLGGFINLVRKKPQAKTGVRVAAQAGSWDTYRTDIDVAGALDTQRRVLGQASIAFEDSGSFIDGVESQRTVLAPGVEWRAAPSTRVLTQLIYQKDRFIPSLGIALLQRGDELVPPEVPTSFFFGRPPTEKSDASITNANLRIDHELSTRWLATLVLQGGRNRLMGIADSYGYGLDDAGNTLLYSSWVAHDNRSWAGELRFDGRFDAFGREHRVLFGVEASRQKFRAWGGGGYPAIGTGNIYDGFADAPSVPGASNPQNYEFLDHVSNRGVYAQAQFSIAERAKLLLGTRFDEAWQSAQNVFDGESAEEQTQRAQTWRVGFTYDVLPTTTAYASYAQSFNPVTERSRSGAILDPERGEGYELGIKAEMFEKRLLATAALFRQELDKRPIPDPAGGTGNIFSISAGLQRTDGLELELSGSPLPGLTVGAAAAWLDAKYVDPNDPNVGLMPGGTTKRQASLHVDYKLQTGALRGLGFGATLLGVGDRFVQTQDADGKPINLRVEGYGRVDLHASYSGLPGWNVSLMLRNAADKRYIEQVNSAFLYAHFFGAPRSWMLRGEYSF